MSDGDDCRYVGWEMRTGRRRARACAIPGPRTDHVLLVTALVTLYILTCVLPAAAQVHKVTVRNLHGPTYVDQTTSQFSKHYIDNIFNGASSARAADMDGDGDMDVVGSASAIDRVSWWENSDGRASLWTEHEVATAFDGAASVWTTDIDGDGDMDVVGAASAGQDVKWWENTDGDGTSWQGHDVDTYFRGACWVHSGDIDNDGDMDILAAASTDDDITWWENTDGDGGAWTEHTIDGSFDGAAAALAVDVDGDGDLDVVGAASSAHDITWWENDSGDGSLWTERTIDGAFLGANAVCAADIDADGDIDILGAGWFNDEISWWENSDGDGESWTEHSVDADFEDARSLCSADLDGDGDADIVAGGKSAGDVSWWENTDGDGEAWSEHSVETAFNGATCVCVADIDGDGYSDILGAAESDHDIIWWENDAELQATFLAPTWTNHLDTSSGLLAYLTNTVSVSETTQYVVTGWARSGSDPGSGAGNNTGIFALTNDSTISWLWNTSFWLSVTAEIGGHVEESNGWYSAGTTNSITAVPSNYYHFVSWTGTVSSGSNPIAVTMDKAHAPVAVFAPDMATNNTPHWWLASHNLTNESWDVEAMSDSDGDGMAAWAEWACGTDPTKRTSVLNVIAVSPGSGQEVLVRWQSVEGRSYEVMRSTNLAEGFASLASSIPATPSENTYTDTVSIADSVFYRIDLDE